MSRPSRNYTALFSITVKAHVMNFFSIWMSAAWIRPMILQVPTPWATPACLLSTNLMSPHLSARLCDMMVDWAPESTKAWMGTLLIEALMYNMLMCPNTSGMYSWANYLFLSMFSR